MFFAGATNVMLAMIWWAAWPSPRAGRTLRHAPAVFPGWLHAFVMQYQMLPSFFFGFLLTTFPKWTKQPDVARRRFVPVGIGLIGGQLVTLAGALGSHAGDRHRRRALTLAGWTRCARRARADAVARDRRRPGTRARASPRSCSATSASSRSARSCSAPRRRGPGEHQDRQLRHAVAGVLHRRAPHVPVLRRQRRRRLSARGGRCGCSRPCGRGCCIHVALTLAQAFAWLWIPDAAARASPIVHVRGAGGRAARSRACSPCCSSASPGLPIALVLYTVDRHRVRHLRRLRARPRAGTCAVHRLLRQRPHRDGHAGHPGPLGTPARDARDRVVRVHRASSSSRSSASPAISRVTRLPGSPSRRSAWLVVLAPWVARIGRIYLAPRADHRPG